MRANKDYLSREQFNQQKSQFTDLAKNLIDQK